MLHYSVLALVKLILIFHVPVTFIQQSLCLHTEQTALGCTSGFLFYAFCFVLFVCCCREARQLPETRSSNLSAQHWPTFVYTFAHARTHPQHSHAVSKKIEKHFVSGSGFKSDLFAVVFVLFCFNFVLIQCPLLMLFVSCVRTGFYT